MISVNNSTLSSDTHALETISVEYILVCSYIYPIFNLINSLSILR